eukprot:1339571-Rhodomonas_salina.1
MRACVQAALWLTGPSLKGAHGELEVGGRVCSFETPTLNARRLDAITCWDERDEILVTVRLSLCSLIKLQPVPSREAVQL